MLVKPGQDQALPQPQAHLGSSSPGILRQSACLGQYLVLTCPLYLHLPTCLRSFPSDVPPRYYHPPKFPSKKKRADTGSSWQMPNSVNDLLPPKVSPLISDRGLLHPEKTLYHALTAPQNNRNSASFLAWHATSGSIYLIIDPCQSSKALWD